MKKCYNAMGSLLKNKKVEVNMNILHLSDIHFGRDYARTNLIEPFEKRKNILNELLECIGIMRKNERPNHIVVTGDIAWWGKRMNIKRQKNGLQDY